MQYPQWLRLHLPLRCFSSPLPSYPCFCNTELSAVLHVHMHFLTSLFLFLVFPLIWHTSLHGAPPSYLANLLTIRQYQLFSDPSSGSDGGLHNALWTWHHSSYIVILPVYVPVSPPGVWVPLIAFSFLYLQNLAGYLTHWRCGHKCLLIEWMLNFTCEDGGEGVGKGFTALINLF